MSAEVAPTDSTGHRDRFFALSSDLLCISGLDGILQDVNPAWARVLGWQPEDLVGKPFLGFVHPDDREATRAAAARLEQGERVIGFENRYRHRDGTWRWLAWNSTPSPEDGLIYAVVRDVTQERRARAWSEELQHVSGVGTWELDLDTQELVWSRETYRIHGLEPEPGVAITMEHGLTHYRPEDAALLGAAFERLRTDGTPYDLELAFRTVQGEHRWVRMTGRARTRGDRIVRVYGSLQDVTERQEQQRQLEQANARLEQAQELARMGHWHADMVTGELTWSPMIYRIFGFDPATMTPSVERFREAVHPDDLEALLASEDRTRVTGSHEFVHRIVQPDGSVRVVREIATSLVGGDGELLALTGIVQDVTEAHEAEQALRASQEQLARALEATRDGWWEVQLPDGVTRCAARWWKMHGYAPQELPATVGLWLSALEEGERTRVLSLFGEATARHERLIEVRSVARRRDGSMFPVELRALVEYDDAGAPSRVTGTSRDLTDLVRSERLQEEFLATVSHELRTPLTSIGGALELLLADRAGPVPEGAAELLEVANRNTRRLRRLIDDLLDAERLASGRQGVVLRSTRLLPALRRSIEDQVARSDGEPARIVLAEVDVDEDLVLSMDAERIEQVLGNYLSNALRYAPPGDPVEVAVTPDAAGVRVTVRDRGPGVPAGFEERAFTRFSQADPGDPRSRGGTGLGLAISREIVERHGGTVGFASVPGRTGFWFTLPLPT